MKYVFFILSICMALSLSNTITADTGEPHWSEVVKQHYPYWRTHYWVDRDLWGNQGYIVGEPPARLAGGQGMGAFEVGAVASETVVIKEEPLEIDPQELKERAGTHTVSKGECLWYIAGYDEIYGNPLKWPLIYKANKDQIKDPDLIYPGQVFAIPRD